MALARWTSCWEKVIHKVLLVCVVVEAGGDRENSLLWSVWDAKSFENAVKFN